MLCFHSDSHRLVWRDCFFYTYIFHLFCLYRSIFMHYFKLFVKIFVKCCFFVFLSNILLYICWQNTKSININKFNSFTKINVCQNPHRWYLEATTKFASFQMNREIERWGNKKKWDKSLLLVTPKFVLGKTEQRFICQLSMNEKCVTEAFSSLFSCCARLLYWFFSICNFWGIVANAIAVASE